MRESEKMYVAMLEGVLDTPLGADATAMKHVTEAFAKVAAMLAREDRGWIPIYGVGHQNDSFGLTLDHLKEWGKKITESRAGAPWMSHGFVLRSSFIWKDGIRHGNIPEPVQGRKNIKAIIDNPLNQLHFFGDDARVQHEGALFDEGIALWIGNEKTKTLEVLPLWQIVDQILDPSGTGLIWAYCRQWSERNIETGEVDNKKRWYFTDQFVSNRVKKIKLSSGKDEEVDQDHVIFDHHANRARGLAYGVPDALAAYIWNGITRDGYMDGVTMQQALATFAFKVGSKSTGGSTKASVELADPQGAGSTALVGQNSLDSLATAGKGYDFSTLDSLLAIVAAALDVSLVHLSSNPKEAGAQTLDLPTRLAMGQRRKSHVALEKRVLRWMGVDAPEVSFVPYDAGDEVYRRVQAVALERKNNTISRQELRDFTDDMLGRPNGTVPAESEHPAVELARALDAEGLSGSSGDDSSTTSTASPEQGVSNDTGGQDGGSASNDIRRDGNDDT